MSTIYRYKLADMSLKEKQIVMNGVLLYSYKWSYSNIEYDFPASVLKEDAVSMTEFENRDRSRKIERIRAVHVDVPTLISEQEELVLDDTDEPSLASPEIIDYTEFNKIELLEYLKKRGFTFKELKGKLKESLLEMAKIDLEMDDED